MKTEKMFILDKNTTICFTGQLSDPVRNGFEILLRDMGKVFCKEYTLTESMKNADIIVSFAKENSPVNGIPEGYSIEFIENAAGTEVIMHLSGTDELGIIYGLLHMSSNYLGVDPFWFWADKEPKTMEFIEIPAVNYISPRRQVRYRGWFVNDEVCLIGWTEVYPPPREVWYPVFEALLRCGGNMVIPGTDLPRNGVHLSLAWEMGLYTTHHHAEPLGAEMFFRAYPNEEASFDKNQALFEGLWREAIEKQKDKKVVWVLGFRGQGDCPFWEQDQSYKTPEHRGELISRVIKRQHEILCEYVENPPCSTYLYGEITELYRQGFIDIPDGVIKIWADNGYGKMVTRRQNNHSLRVPSLPVESEAGPHGLYYHITFHDLQASNHLTMFPTEPGLVKDELTKAFDAGTDRYLLLNSGNIKPHVYFLDIVKELWNTGYIDIGEHLVKFCNTYFGSASEAALECYKEYFDTTILYGNNYDDHAGEEFYHHPARAVIKHWLCGKSGETAESLWWAAGEKNFADQIDWFYNKLASAVNGWENLKRKCLDTVEKLNKGEAVFFRDHILLQVELHLSGCKGFIFLCKSFFAFRENNFPLSFVYASEAIWNYNESLTAMAKAEHDRWYNFYRADWLTNVKSTIYSLEALRKYLRMQGDSPDFFLWYKEYIMPESEKKIYLENTHRNPLPDDELAKMLKDKLPVY